MSITTKPTDTVDIEKTRWRIDPARSSVEFRTRTFWGTITVKGRFERYDGTLDLRREPAIELTIDAASLNTRNKMRDKHLRSADFFDVGNHPEVRFVSEGASGAPVARGHYRARIAGRLSLHGVTQPHAVNAEVLLFADGVRLRGESTLRLSDYRIRPVTALGGTIRLKDELKVSFNLAGLPEGP